MDLKVQPSFTGRKLTAYEATNLIHRNWLNPYSIYVPRSSFARKRQIVNNIHFIAGIIKKVAKFFNKELV